MIVSFRSRALQRYWESSDRRGLNPQHVAKIDRILAALHRASVVEDMALPGYRLHKL